MRESVGYHPLGPLTLLGTAVVAVTNDEDRAIWARAHRPSIAAMVTVWVGVWLARFVADRRG